MSDTDRPETPLDRDTHELRRANSQTTELQRNVQMRIQREKTQLLRDWTAAGGSHADFEEIWPSIHAQLGQIRVQEIGDRARSRPLSTFRK